MKLVFFKILATILTTLGNDSQSVLLVSLVVFGLTLVVRERIIAQVQFRI